MEWLLVTFAGIVSALLIRGAFRAVVRACDEDGRWHEWRADDGVVIGCDAAPEQDFDLPAGEPRCMAPGWSTNGAPNTGRGSIGLRVRG